MPFGTCWMPPIGLGILKGALSRSGLASTIYHFNLDILPELGANAADALKTSDLIVSPRQTLIGEWLFSKPEAARDERYLAHLLEKGFEPGDVARFRDLRPRLDAWIERWAGRVVRGGHDIVGFSCSFERTRASVRLAEAIRALAPRTRLVAGGFSATGDMGLAMLEAFDAFDLVCHAEGDEVIVPIVEALRGRPGASLDAIRGISYRHEGRVVTQMRGAAPAELDRTPLPDYGDFFEQVETLRASWDPALDLPRALPLETARGCWWGARTPCTFCSLNGDRITFRSKSPGRVLEEIARLHQEYGTKPFAVVDNILNDAFFDTLLPELARQRPKKAFSWEVRAHLGRDQAAALARAGVVHVQPGIESLSTPVLRLMHKGTSGIGNVQALKWLSAYRIRCGWNFLFSLPGERVEWYDEVARVIPRLMHLPPPIGLYRISLQRFSPLFARASGGEVKVTGPTVFTRLVFDDVRSDCLDRLSYEFDYEIAGRPPGLDARIREILDPPLRAWRDAYETNGCTLSLITGRASRCSSSARPSSPRGSRGSRGRCGASSGAASPSRRSGDCCRRLPAPRQTREAENLRSMPGRIASWPLNSARSAPDSRTFPRLTFPTSCGSPTSGDGSTGSPAGSWRSRSIRRTSSRAER